MRDKIKKESLKKEKIFLTQSYFKYPLPEEMLRELAEELKDINLYPSGGDYTELRQVLAKNVGVKIENILPTNGSDDVIEEYNVIYNNKNKTRIISNSPSFLF